MPCRLSSPILRLFPFLPQRGKKGGEGIEMKPNIFDQTNGVGRKEQSLPKRGACVDGKEERRVEGEKGDGS